MFIPPKVWLWPFCWWRLKCPEDFFWSPVGPKRLLRAAGLGLASWSLRFLKAEDSFAGWAGASASGVSGRLMSMAAAVWAARSVSMRGVEAAAAAIEDFFAAGLAGDLAGAFAAAAAAG